MALTIAIKVVPSSGKSAWQRGKNGQLKCFLKSPPERGAANKELVKMLSKLLRVIQQDIEIIAGLTDRKKILKIHTALTLEEFLQKIGVDTQLCLTN